MTSPFVRLQADPNVEHARGAMRLPLAPTVCPLGSSAGVILTNIAWLERPW